VHIQVEARGDVACVSQRLAEAVVRLVAWVGEVGSSVLHCVIWLKIWAEEAEM
jgi:hypothetical protein